MKLPSVTTIVSVLLSALLISGCKENPTAEQACTVGVNGGNPVIVVAGTFSPELANELFLGNALHAAGFTHCVLELKGDEALGGLPGTMPVEVSAIALSLFVDDVLTWSGASQVDLVGHSQGALATRAYIKNYGGEPKVDKMISLSGPNAGTEFVPLLEFFVGPVLAPFGVTCETLSPCTQMELNSDFITDLNAGGMTPGNVDYYAFYTNNDELVWYWSTGFLGLPIISYDNAKLGPDATNIEIGQMCPLRVVGHLGMIIDPVPIHMTLDALAGRSISVPLTTCLLPPVII